MIEKKYESPRLEIIDDFQVDIITTSCQGNKCPTHQGCVIGDKPQLNTLDDDLPNQF
ncbi:MAG: hypothetical protein Q4E88_00220 [Coriobacteriia bacterium]|nr:hypothetical protein [Coriobacteriia bacterium]